MIKVKVTKNIIRKGEVAFGFNKKQLIVGAAGIATGITMYMSLRKVMSTDMLMTLIFITMTAFIVLGIAQINNVPLLAFILKGSNDKRPFNRKKWTEEPERIDNEEKENKKWRLFKR